MYKNTRRQCCWFKPSYWGQDGGGYGFCPNTFTKDAHTNSATSTFSIFMSAREKWQEWVTAAVHTTQRPLIYFSPLLFLDCAHEHVWHLWERKSTSVYMRKCGSRRVHQEGRGASTLAALYSSTNSKPQSHFCYTERNQKSAVILDLQLLLTSLSSLDAGFLTF